MAIQLAFSTVACPGWTIDEVAQRAAAMGYQGVELRTHGGGEGLASDPASGSADKTRDVLRAAGIEPVCLSTSFTLHHKSDQTARQVHRQILDAIHLAAHIGFSSIRVFGGWYEPGENSRSVLQRIAKRARALMDVAMDAGVHVLFENSRPFSQAKPWWWLLDLVEHPMAGMCWNVMDAAAAGESPAVSVPNLHSRIRLAKITDVIFGEGSGFVPIGAGEVEIHDFVNRLLGIGYDGYISVEWDPTWAPNLAAADEVLPQARETVQGWLGDVAGEIELAVSGKKK